MKDLEGNELSREETLAFAEELSLKEFSSIISRNYKAIAVIDPWDKTICFSDSMSDIFGVAVSNTMYLSQFYQYITDDVRAVNTSRYDSIISQLKDGAVPNAALEHTVKGINGEVYRFRFDMKAVSFGKTRVILAVVTNETPKFEERVYNQLFGPSIDSYLFVYDAKQDTCRLSERFVKDFDFDSNLLPNFRESIFQYVHPEDAFALRTALEAYMESHQLDTGLTVRFLAPARGEVHLRIDGFSHHGTDGNLISGICSDVTDFARNEYLQSNIFDGLSAAMFLTDLHKNITTFNEKIANFFPEFTREVSGDIVEIIASQLLPMDRQRFRNVLGRSVNEPGTCFSVEVRIKNEDNKFQWVAIRGKSFENKNAMTRSLSGAIFDLSQMNEVKENFEKTGAAHGVTGLPMRHKLEKDIDTLIRDRKTLAAAVALIDINDFHDIVDRYGSNNADNVLTKLSKRINKSVPQEAKLYHIDTDVFAVLWPGATSIKVNEFMQNMIDSCDAPYPTSKGDVYLNLIESAAFYPEGKTSSELLTQAEITLHKVKEDKTLKYAIFSPADRNDLKEKLDFQMTLSSDIRNGFTNFMLYYQPLTDAKTGELRGAEALLRWMKPSGEPENPEKVVAALEAIDQMASVGNWILNEAIRQCSEWIHKGAPQDFFVHINATAEDLVAEDYVDRVVESLTKYNLPARNIIIELTETSFMKNMSSCRRNIKLLHENGIKTALDDFGSGYSSFDYLKELPVSEIKIDKTFVDDMLTSKFDNSFIAAMTILSHSIDKGVVVEGVESKEQYEALRDMGVDIIQGFYFGKPMSVFAFWNNYFA